MKKIIAISVMLALIAGVVFAETSVGGSLETRYKLAKQEGGEKDDPKSGGLEYGDRFVTLTGQNSDGTLGGHFRLGEGWSGDDVKFYKAYTWWKPIEQVKITLGKDGDGWLGVDDVVGWGFHKGEQGYLNFHDWDLWGGLFGKGMGDGLLLSFYPIEGLDINLSLGKGEKWLTDSASKAYDGKIPSDLALQINYNISDIGKITFVYQGAGRGGFTYKNALTDAWGMSNGLEIADQQIGASFLLTAVENLQVKVGGSYITADPDGLAEAGLGVDWNGDGFGARFRLGAILYQASGFDPVIAAGVYPYVKVGDNGEAAIDIAITQDGNCESPYKTLGWGVTPSYKLNIEGGHFAIGIKVYNNLAGNQMISGADYVKWAVPMCLAFSF